MAPITAIGEHQIVRAIDFDTGRGENTTPLPRLRVHEDRTIRSKTVGKILERWELGKQCPEHGAVQQPSTTE
jgi:hypothetical protein